MERKILEEIGLTKGEIGVYFSLLETGSSTVGPIIKKAKVSSSKIYDILDRLIHKGLVSYVIKENRKYFEAASPIRILDYLREKEESVRKQHEEIEKILPQLLLKQSLSEKKQEVNIYEGAKGIKTAREKILQVLKRGEEAYFLGASALSSEKFKDYWQDYHRRRDKAGIKAKALFNQNVPQEELDNRNSFKYCQAKYLPFDIVTPSWIEIFKDTTIIGVPSENPIALEIKNKDVTQSFKSYFEALWNQETTTLRGYTGLKTLCEEILKEKSDLYLIGANNFFTKKYPQYFQDWDRQRVSAGIKRNHLSIEDTRNSRFNKLPITKTRYLPKHLSSPMVIWIFGSKVAHVLWDTEIIFLIENKLVADDYRKYFELLWKNANE